MRKDNSPIVFSIPRHCKDMRLDAALFTLLKEKYPENKALSRGFVTRLIRAGHVALNGALAKPSTPVDMHDRVEVSEEEALSLGKVSLRSNEDLAVEVLFEDDQVIVLNKSGDMQTHPAGRHMDDTLANWLIARYPALKKVGENMLRPGIVHRLDRETSGALVVAKTQKSFAQLKKLFQERRVEKTYAALVYGHLAPLEGVIDRPLVRQSGELKRRVIEQQGSTAGLTGNIRAAVTNYRVIARYRDFDLVLLAPQTGRTHQIRAHLASLGHPVVGDKLYAFKSMRYGRALFPPRHMLHAWRLKWELFGHPYACAAPLPDDFRNILRDIDETKEAGYDSEALKSLFSE
jgi:23S rRNA pseudouridine1911/1915/1917 synthase